MKSYLLYYTDRICKKVEEYATPEAGSAALDQALDAIANQPNQTVIHVMATSKEDLFTTPAYQVGGQLDEDGDDGLLSDVDD